MSDGDELSTYCAKARDWLERNIPVLASDASELGQLVGESEAAFATRSRRLQGALYEGGYAGITVDPRFGGQGLTEAHQAVFDEEAARYERPGVFGGTLLPIFPTLERHCSE